MVYTIEPFENGIRGIMQKLLLMLFFIMFSSCVGTIEEQQGIDTTRVATLSDMEFDGVLSAHIVSHDKVTLKFNSARKGSGSFNYLAYVNGSKFSSSAIDGNLARVHQDGTIHLTVTGLTKGVTYTFNVQAKDKITNELDGNEKTVVATTFGNVYPNFEGVLNLNSISGVDGETKIIVNWNKASPGTTNFNPFISDPHAIAGYRIYYGTNEATIDFNNPISVNGEDTTSYTLTGLTPGTIYYIIVRSVDSHSPVREDKNIVIKSLSTKNTGRPITFNGIADANLATSPNASAGFNKIDLSWNAGEGSFDRYKIFYSTNTTAAFDPQIDTVAAVITDLSETNYTLSVADPHTIHYVAVVACNGDLCTNYKGHDRIEAIRTSPQVAPFNGIKTITSPTSGADMLTSLILNFDAPDTNLGVTDEMKYFISDINGQYNPLTDEIPAYTGIGIGFDSSTETNTSVTIKGLTPGTQYCFIAKAYSLSPVDPDEPTGRTHLNEKFMCSTPQHVLPGFNGVHTSCSNITTTSFEITWTAPNPFGTFAHYEIYYKVFDGNFDFSDAVNDPYNTIIAASNKTNHTFSGLTPGVTYQIGVRTYFQFPDTSIVRDSNQVIATCTTNSAKAVHNSWFNIMSLGRKINFHTDSVIPERLTSSDAALAVDGLYAYPYPQEFGAGLPGVDHSTNGIIHIVWDDFSLSGGLGSMKDFISSGSGYNIYRKAYQPLHDTIRPTLVNDISPGSWQKLNTDPIPPAARFIDGQIKYLGEYVDYNHDRSLLATNETKIYWYKVEAAFNNVNMAFESTPPDGVIKVILPPDNTAFVHRNIMNREMCELMQLPIDRTSFNRCPFNGFGSRNGYLDYEHHLIVDRFENGVKYSKGVCAINPSGDGDIFDGAPGDPGSPADGDCIAYRGPSTWVHNALVAPYGSVMYGREWGEILVQTDNPTGAIWKAIVHNNVGDSAVESFSIAEDNNQTKIPEYDPIKFPNGQGLGQTWITNAAKAPPAKLPLIVAARTCESYLVEHKNESIYKTLPRKHEWIGMAAYPPYISFTTATSIAGGALPAGSNGRDCLTATYGTSNYGLPVNFSELNWVHTGGAFIETGSAGIKSTEACVSRYGIQDLYGNYGETISTILYGVSPTFSSFVYSDAALTTEFTQPYDLEAKEYMKSQSGEYLSFLSSGASNGSYQNVTSASTAAAGDYFNPYLGISLNCTPPTCDNGASDDLRITAKASAAGAIIVNFPVTGVLRTATNGGPKMGLITGGSYASGNTNSRYSSATIGSNYDMAVRCIARIEDN